MRIFFLHKWLFFSPSPCARLDWFLFSLSTRLFSYIKSFFRIFFFICGVYRAQNHWIIPATRPLTVTRNSSHATSSSSSTAHRVHISALSPCYGEVSSAMWRNDDQAAEEKKCSIASTNTVRRRRGRVREEKTDRAISCLLPWVSYIENKKKVKKSRIECYDGRRGRDKRRSKEKKVNLKSINSQFKHHNCQSQRPANLIKLSIFHVQWTSYAADCETLSR